MKHLNESERILTVLGAVLVVAALALSIATELNARGHVAEYRKQVAAAKPAIPAAGTAAVVQQGAPVAPYDKHIGYVQQTLASRWSIPDGHATLGAGFSLFGMLLIAAPRAAAKKRATG